MDLKMDRQTKKRQMDLKMNRLTQIFVNGHKEGQVLNKASLIDKKE